MATIQGLWWLGHHHADLHSENILREHLQNRSSGHIYNASRISPISGESFTHTQLHIYIYLNILCVVCVWVCVCVQSRITRNGSMQIRQTRRPFAKTPFT
jgi:hypothetical protein